ncbi:hypothetical protein [Mariprofundus aestuarium]|nr:hypothetical protein [Mariprofundus aestuarium]
MRDIQAPVCPNIVDLFVVIITCMGVLFLAFPLYADEQPSAKVEVSRVELPKTEKAVKQIDAVEPEKSAADKQVSKAVAAEEGDAEVFKQEQITVDIEALKTRLKETDAIGVFTKLAIRSDILDLVDEINRYRKQAKLESKIAEVRASFDGLLLKMVALLEGDPTLSRDLYVSRESIWKSLLEVKA